MKKRNLLVVDDDDSVCVMVSMILGEIYDVHIAHDGYSAVTMIKQEPPEIVLCDIVMDRGDGFSVIEFLRSHDEFHEIPIVMMTSMSDKDIQRKGMHLGADDVIQKPFSEQELIVSLAARMKRYELEQQLHNTMDQMRAVFESVPDMFFRISKNGAIIEQYVNPVILEQIQTLQFNSTNIFSFIPAHYHNDIQKSIERVMVSRQVMSMDITIFFYRGSQYYELRFMPFRLKDEVLCVVRDVTDKKLQDEALQLSERKFSTVFFSSPSMMCIYEREHGWCIDVNDSFCINTGYSKEDLFGRSMFTARILQPQLFEEIELNHRSERDHFFKAEIDYVTKNEEVRYGIVQCETITIQEKSCIILFIRDITREKQGEELLLERYDIFKQLTDAIDDVVWIHDTDGRVIYYKPSSKYSPLPRSSVGKKPSELDGKDIFSQNIQQVISLNKSLVSVETISIDGEDVTFSIRWNPICNITNTVVAVSVFAKTTSGASLQDHNALRPNDLYHKIFLKLRMFRHGESLLMIINRLLLFSRNINHFSSLSSAEGDPTAEDNVVKRISIVINEYLLRVYPELNTLAMYAQLLSEISIKELHDNSFHKLAENMLKLNKFNYDYLIQINSPDGKRKRRTEALNNESITLFYHNLTQLKSVILKLNKNIKQQYVTDVHQTVYDVLNSISSKTVDYDIQFIPSHELSLGIIRRSELYEIILIIVKNAIEAMESYRSESTKPAIMISTSNSGEYLKIIISDNGPGISDQLRDEIFVFGTSSKNTGRGFGLYYAKNIIKEYGGELTFNQNNPTGTTFIISVLIP